jgi:uncharacterized membrane protein YfcA
LELTALPPLTLGILCFFIFLAGFVDSIAGGGGLLSIPAYLMAGLPPHLAAGTNKLSASLGTTISTIRYFRSGRVHLAAAAASALLAFPGSFLGSKAALALPSEGFRVAMLVLIPVAAVLVLSRKNHGDEEDRRTPKVTGWAFWVLCAGIGFTVGFYDGFFGPGAGTFVLMFHNVVLGFGLRTASGNAKVVNLSSNYAALAVFIAAGQVMWVTGLVAGACGIAGNWLGSGLAIRNGARAIRPVFVGVLILLFAKVFYDAVF